VSRLLALVLPLGSLTCVRLDLAPVAPIPDAPAPELRVALALDRLSVRLDGPLRLGEPGASLRAFPPGAALTVRAGSPGVIAQDAGRTGAESLGPFPVLEVRPLDSAGTVRVEGRSYRGALLLSAPAGRVTVVNFVEVDAYVAGVVGAELGRRPETELEAVRAQAIVSRTVALRALGRWRLRGFDLVAGVSDQVYTGADAETPLGLRAVRQTRGQVLTWQGRVIDAFFHSTCAGRTADGTEVFAAADRPYLRSIRDEDTQGRAWCADSPRFRWEERWSAELFTRTLAETLPAAGGPAELAAGLEDLRVSAVTESGRVERMELLGASRAFAVSGVVARQVLRPPSGGMLRSAAFSIRLTRSGGRIESVTVEGAGAGHGVGLCQWGSFARARAGASHGDILSAYFPGTILTRLF